MSMSTEQQQQTAVTKKHSVSTERRRAKSKKKTAQDPYDSLYGRVPLKMFHERPWTYAGWLDGSKVGNYVLLFGNVMRVRPLSKTSTIVVLLSRCRTVRCMVVASADEGVTTRMVRFAATLRRGTYLEVEGVVSPPGMETDMLLRTTQQVEIQVRKLYTIATNKDGSLVDGVTTTEEDDDGAVDGVTTMADGNPVDGVVATMEISSPVHGVIIDGVTTIEDISLVGRATTAEDGSLVHGVTVDGVATMEDDILVDSVATIEDDSQVDGASQSSSISIPTRPSIMLEENLVGREGEPRWVGQAGWGLAHADERPSLNYDYANPLPVCHAIFRIHSEVEYKIMEFLRSMNFVGIHTHGTFAGSAEGGLAVVNPEDITGQRTFLAQSPLLYKQMATCEVKRVFEIGPLFRHENSNCKMHTCDLAAEMEIKDHYLEVCDIVNALLVDLFKHLNKNCKKELEAISQRYPAEPPKYLEETLMLKYDDGIQMLKEAGTEVKHMTDLTGKHQQELCRLVREKYGTDLFILHQHPSAVCPLYTMPCVGNPAYSNSFDVFFRGEQVISGSQRIHERGFFVKRAAEYGIDIDHVLDNFRFWRYGVPPHGGFRACLSRVVMLFCGLDHF
ncbi:hypothetical protein QYE76_045892 [Lolium multiflorum]|uniref:aspartate--tRNA ligase n=1 Tax=Lolium multiflorum TaxID=4521 RepID=A0AAD8TL53_LOLMU|nr:hypothetical protein QYE76_045892 [Lolium multiflorum]